MIASFLAHSFMVDTAPIAPKEKARFKVLKPPPAGLREVRRHWPLALGWLLLLAISGGMVAITIAQNGGKFTYSIDYAYIHTAMARNFALHGVWGVNRHNFSSCTSGPLWTFLLAFVYKLFGDSEMAPLVLNLLLSMWLLAYLYIVFRRREASPALTFGVLLAALLLTPLPALAMIGMEHTLQILLCVPFVVIAARSLAHRFDPEEHNPPFIPLDMWLLLALAPLMTMARYEGAFLVLSVAVLLVTRRRLVHALLLCVMGALSIAFYGVLSLREGWYFLPNSILLQDIALLTLSKMFRDPEIIGFMIACGWLLWASHRGIVRVRDETAYLARIVIGAGALHLLFAQTGVFFRYEAYIVTIAMLALGAALQEGALRPLASQPADKMAITTPLAVSILLLLAPLMLWRAFTGLQTPTTAAANLYRQQYQIARFLHQYYNDKAVALNDIGTTNYYSDIRLVDLYGLGTREVGHARYEGRFDAARLDAMCRKLAAHIAIITEHWREPPLPAHWIPVARWTYGDAKGGRSSVFYALDPAEAPRVGHELEQFDRKLPAGISTTLLKHPAASTRLAAP